MKVVRLTGTLYDHLKCEDILRKIIDSGAYTATIASREIVIEAPLERLDEIKDLLRKLRINDVRVREAHLIESTVTQSGVGKDADEVVRVNLAPASRVVGYRLLNIFIDPKICGDKKAEELSNIYNNFVKYILQKAGVTDVVYSIEVLKKRDDMEAALEEATINAIMAANGIIQINA